MKRLIFVVFLLSFALGASTLTLEAGEMGEKEHLLGSAESSGGGALGTIADGPAHVRLNAFGAANQFQYGTGPGTNHLFEALHFVSVNNGPVQAVSASSGYSVVTPLAVSGRTSCTSCTSYSAVTKGNLFIEFYNTVIDDEFETMDWYIETYLYNTGDDPLTVCYYHYIDLDLFGQSEGNVATAGPDPEYGGRPSFRLQYPPRPDARFLVASLAGLDRFEMRIWPQVRDMLTGAQNCVMLSNQLPGLTGDFTGAMQYSTTIPAQGFAHADLVVSRLQ